MPAIETDGLRFEVEENPPRGRFKLVNDEGQMLGEMIFSRARDDLVNIEHTEVDDSLRGKKGGLRLFQGMVAWARETKTGITSTCPFVDRMFDRDPSSRDVLEPS
ncbi:MAG: N-acetyltransferase [Myxococcales bacterium]|nr:N-acetyltransferase [Myxococcales bacterium]MDH3483747.1 N-acetyltransferase [Myxococcales bacterium]